MEFDELRGNRILITGASTGIGAAGARRMGAFDAGVGAYLFLATDALSGCVTGQVL